MIILVAVAAAAVFLITFHALDLAQIGLHALRTAGAGMTAMRDAGIDDTDRERAVRAASVTLMRAFFSIVFRVSLCFLASAFVIWLAGITGLSAVGEVVAFLSRADVIGISFVVVTVGCILWLRLRHSK
jgi:hypothetical protein